MRCHLLGEVGPILQPLSTVVREEDEILHTHVHTLSMNDGLVSKVHT